MIVCAPSAVLYAEPDLMAEQVDEVLYGEEVEITAEQGGFYKIKTDYGYEGWSIKQNFFEKLHDPAFMVKVPFADLLFDGKNYYHAPITLPFGSRVDVGFGHDERYGFIVLPSKRIYYIHKKHIRPIASPKPAAEQETRESIAATALSYLGAQYRWGGRTPAGVDCSGLCFNAYRFNGLSIWRDADISRSPAVKPIPLSQAQRGDLLYFEGHMAVYLGGTEFVHASAAEGAVCIGSTGDEALMQKFLTAGTVF